MLTLDQHLNSARRWGHHQASDRPPAGFYPHPSSLICRDASAWLLSLGARHICLLLSSALTPSQYPALSQPKAGYSIKQASVVVVSSDSDFDTSSQISTSRKSSLRSPSPTSRQSGRIRKPTRKIESQRRRAAEEGIRAKKRRKFAKQNW